MAGRAGSVRAEAGLVRAEVLAVWAGLGAARPACTEPESEPGARAVRAEAAGHHFAGGMKVMEQFPCAADGLGKSRLEVFRAPV
jgi:hypothetical protein